MKRIPKYCYYDKRGGNLYKRSNFSDLKLAILKVLCRIDRDESVRATAYDSKLQEGYYDVVTIARHVCGAAVFVNNELNVSTRTSLNNSLQALYMDGFTDRTGNRYYPSHQRLAHSIREFQRNHWRITAEGKKVVSAWRNGWLESYLSANKYVGENGAFSVSDVMKVLNDGR